MHVQPGKSSVMAMFSDSEFEAACSFAAQSVGVLELNNYQKESLKVITSGRDVLVSLPTGFGKSIWGFGSPGISSIGILMEKMRSRYY